jgi:nitroreductase
MNVSDIDARAIREAGSGNAHPQFASRWSPRAMSGEALTRDEVTSLLDAARWAPSCFNEQPWRFAWALSGTPQWQPVFDVLVEANQVWVKNAGALFAVISRRRFSRNEKPNPTHSFDTGAAWVSLALQAEHMGLIAHGMQGFDHDGARQALAVPPGYDLPCIFAVGRPGNIEDLPESRREGEVPSRRKPLDEIAYHGDFRSLDPA